MGDTCTPSLIVIATTVNQFVLYTVSPVEKLTNRTTGTLPVRLRYGRGTVAGGRGTVAVRSRYGRGTVAVRSRYGRGTVEVRSRCGRGTVEVLSRFGRGAARHSMVAVRSWYSRNNSRVVRYTQGSFPPGILDAPRTWYIHVLFVLLFESRNRGLAGFGSAIDTIPYGTYCIVSTV